MQADEWGEEQRSMQLRKKIYSFYFNEIKNDARISK